MQFDLFCKKITSLKMHAHLYFTYRLISSLIYCIFFKWEKQIMSFKPAMELAKLQQVAVIDGEKILFIWHNDQVHAVQSQCPHLKLPLTKGKITGDSSIICPFHKSEFDLKTGEAKCWSPWPPVVGNVLGMISKEKNLKIYPTQIENGQILVQTSTC
jgi:nitrite reductase/ring-hydroxylating ferredoxin subunit